MSDHTQDGKGNSENKKPQADPFTIPGHPLHTMRLENMAVEAFMSGPLQAHLDALDTDDGPELRSTLIKDVETLGEIERHYRRIEILLLPYLERMGQIAPVKVITAIHNDVMRMIRDLKDDLLLSDSEPNGIKAFAAFLIRDIQIVMRQEREAYSSQAQILVSEAEWGEIAKANETFGYCMIEPPVSWTSSESKTAKERP